MMIALKTNGLKIKMEIINLTPEVAELNDRTFNLGAMKKGTKKDFSVLIKDVKHRGVGVSCGGCTTATAVPREDGVQLDITYKANGMKGVFNKSVTESTIDGQRIEFKLTGTIV